MTPLSQTDKESEKKKMHQGLQIIGNLGRDPESRYTDNGKMVTNFSVAVNRRRGEVNETMWIRVTTWEKTAENCVKFLKKGSKVFIEGELIFDPATGGPKLYKTRDGNTGANFEMTAHKVVFLDSRERSDQPAAQAAPSEDVPF